MQDLKGQTFERLTVVSRAENNRFGKLRWNCLCECGNTKIVASESLRHGTTKSCGCLSRELTSQRKLKDMTGLKFGKLTVLHRAEVIRRGKVCWHCQCDCGNTTVASGADLRRGDTQTCGCSRLEGVVTHGYVYHELYNTWRKIKERCYNPNAINYGRYGAKGVRFYEPWRKDAGVFIRYLEENLGPRPAGMTLDRYPNKDGDYEPDNLRWATPKEQAENTTRNLPDCISYGNSLYTQLSHWKHRGELSEEWLGGYGINWDQIIKDIGNPPMENSKLKRVNKLAPVGPDNVVWEVAYS